MFIHEWNEPSRLYSVSIHQIAPPSRNFAHSITAHYSFIDHDDDDNNNNKCKHVPVEEKY